MKLLHNDMQIETMSFHPGAGFRKFLKQILLFSDFTIRLSLTIFSFCLHQSKNRTEQFNAAEGFYRP